jgi:pyrroloquinoline quinone biosynthesis protein B
MTMIRSCTVLLLAGLAACGSSAEPHGRSVATGAPGGGGAGEALRALAENMPHAPAGAFVVVLGTGQDGGYPQAGTQPGEAWAPERRRYAASLAVVDPVTGERWLFEATPDLRDQLHLLDRLAPAASVPGLAGVFLTHAHVGHYAGLIHFGREIIGARGVPVYVMPRFAGFLRTHGPWEQLVTLGNIELRELRADQPVRLNERITVTPFVVPHRDEYSETVAYRIAGPARTVLFLPDIDKWERWVAESGVRIEDVVAGVDVAYLDATFHTDGEIPNRSMAEIPHPFITETMARFDPLSAELRDRIRFIHLNRTNPVGLDGTPERRAVEAAGYRVARLLEIVEL